jgi:hypothetical protein
MARLSITTAWNESALFVRREARLLFPIAFLLVSLPGLVLRLAMPAVEPGQATPPGFWLLLLPVALSLGLIGTLALSFLALRPGASVGEALRRGGRRFLLLLAAILLAVVGPTLAAALLLAAAGPGSGAAGARADALLLSLLIIPFVALWVRLMLMTPVAAVEDVGPVRIIQRSWALTRGHFWKLLGFVLLSAIAVLVLLFAVSATGGILIFLVAGPPRPDSFAMMLVLLLAALLQAAISALFATLTARIYAQLSRPRTPDVFA